MSALNPVGLQPAFPAFKALNAPLKPYLQREVIRLGQVIDELEEKLVLSKQALQKAKDELSVIS